MINSSALSGIEQNQDKTYNAASTSQTVGTSVRSEVGM